jgi:hypothetical protein
MVGGEKNLRSLRESVARLCTALRSGAERDVRKRWREEGKRTGRNDPTHLRLCRAGVRPMGYVRGLALTVCITPSSKLENRILRAATLGLVAARGIFQNFATSSA